MEKKTVVLYPGVGVGHLSPMLELANAFLRHGGDHVSVAIAVVEPPVSATGFAATVARGRAPGPPTPPSPSTSSPHRRRLPAATPRKRPSHPWPRCSASSAPRTRRCATCSARSRRRAASRRSSSTCSAPTRSTSRTTSPCTPTSSSPRAPPASPASSAFPPCGQAWARASGRSGTTPSCRSRVLLRSKSPTCPTASRTTARRARASRTAAARMPDARGILINSFESLEPRAMRALRDGLCVPDHRTPPVRGGSIQNNHWCHLLFPWHHLTQMSTNKHIFQWRLGELIGVTGHHKKGLDPPLPPVYCVGPLVSPSGGDRDHECLWWMDAQPDRSVVFLCFGSMGTLPKEQLEEIAVGLERSGQRFLWVVRSPPGAGGDGEPAADDVIALLPVGFLERTVGRGLVVTSWAPQVDVLRHRAAGAFVTHCGWNSTLEGITAGLPLLCWPLYAEQKLNKVRIVEEMKLGVEMERSRVGDEDVVKAEEVEAKVTG